MELSGLGMGWVSHLASCQPVPDATSASRCVCVLQLGIAKTQTVLGGWRGGGGSPAERVPTWSPSKLPCVRFTR